MVNACSYDPGGAVAVTDPANPERALALSYAPADRRNGLIALLALDDTLGQILRTTREPIVGQMRLTWWHTALSDLDHAPPPAQPVLQALAAEVMPCGVSGARLAEMIDGWEALLDPDPLEREALAAYGEARGGVLFEAAGQVLGAAAADPLSVAGAGWALADLARHTRDSAPAARAAAMAAEALDRAGRQRWSRPVRALGALTHIARMDLAAPEGVSRVGAPSRVARLAWHLFTGR